MARRAAIPVAEIHVEGLAQLTKTFSKAPKEVNRAYRAELRTVAKPVHSSAESLAATRIRNLAAGDPWAKFRIGVTQRSIYVAPRQKGARGRGKRARGARTKRSFADLMAERVTGPALEQNRRRIEQDFERMLDRLVRKWDHDGP